MRLILSAILSLTLAGTAFAQATGVTIEDDVSHANAVACAGLRAAQVAKAPDARVTAAHAAWLKSLAAAGHDPAMTDKEIAAEAARVASLAPAAVAAKVSACEAFEIR